MFKRLTREDVSYSLHSKGKNHYRVMNQQTGHKSKGKMTKQYLKDQQKRQLMNFQKNCIDVRDLLDAFEKHATSFVPNL